MLVIGDDADVTIVSKTLQTNAIKHVQVKSNTSVTTRHVKITVQTHYTKQTLH